MLGKNNPRQAKYLFLVIWALCVVAFYVLGEATESETAIITSLLAGLLSYVFYLIYLLLQILEINKGARKLGVLLLNISGTLGLFVLISAIAIIMLDVDAITEPEPAEYSENENIECYIKGTKVFTDRESCRKLSEETVTERNSEVRYVPITPPARPKINFPAPEDLRQTCTKCDTNYAGQVVCQTYKAFICY